MKMHEACTERVRSDFLIFIIVTFIVFEIYSNILSQIAAVLWYKIKTNVEFFLFYCAKRAESDFSSGKLDKKTK